MIYICTNLDINEQTDKLVKISKQIKIFVGCDLLNVTLRCWKCILGNNVLQREKYERRWRPVLQIYDDSVPNGINQQYLTTINKSANVSA